MKVNMCVLNSECTACSYSTAVVVMSTEVECEHSTPYLLVGPEPAAACEVWRDSSLLAAPGKGSTETLGVCDCFGLV